MLNKTNLLSKYKELYKEVDEKYILSKWNSVKSQNLHLYIHNPFCQEHCKYCVYKGHLVDLDSEEDKRAINQYYEEYLPKQIEKYKETIKNNNVKTIMLGGGTPNIVNPILMETLFSQINELQTDNTHKIIEIHPNNTTKEHLELIVKHKFNTVIIGIQSFDRELLKSQNRRVHTFEHIKFIVDYLKEHNVFVCADILTFLTDNVESDIEILNEDLEKIELLNLDEISVMSIFSKTIGNKENTKKFSDAVKTYITQSKNYNWELDNLEFLEDYKLEHKAIRMIKKSLSKEYLDTKILPHPGRQDPLGSTPCKNILGIGSYRNVSKNTFSVINGELEYIEVNLDNNPNYFIRYDENEEKSFTELIQEYLKKIDKIGRVPDKLKFEFKANIYIYNLDTLFETKRKKLSVKIDYPRDDENCIEFVEKYRTFIKNEK